MATIGTPALTLVDWGKRIDPNGSVAKITELLAETNEILDDMPWVEGNLPTGHRTTVRTSLPAATWRKLNYGVQPTKSLTAQVDDTCGMLEAYAEVDKSLADLNGNTAEFRLTEDRAFLEAMNQEFCDILIYGDTDVTPEKFLGLTPRYYDLITSTNNNVFSAGGSGSSTDLSSIWLVVWGPNTVHGIFPKGSKAGISSQDLGEQTLYDSASPAGRYQGYRTHYKWDCGLCVRDWRYIVRISNIEVAIATTGFTSNSLTSVNLLLQALNRIPSLKMGKPVFYCNREIKTQFDILASNKSNSFYMKESPFGQMVTHFMGVPIKRVDSILSTEATVS
jgi:hypothetical protein